MNKELMKDDFENYLKKQFKSINQKNIEQENSRHDRFIEKHAEKADELSRRHSSSISQLITLEGAILTAVVVFGKPQEATLWLIIAICLILISIFFGVWLQSIATQAEYQSHEWEYQQEMKHNWFVRELWKDDIKAEKELIEPYLNEREYAYKKTFTYKFLKIFHLNHDRIENIFKITFLISLLFLIIHFVNIPF